jgi:hypothetical protein
MSIKVLVDTLMCNCCVYLLVVPEVRLLKQVGLTRFCLHGKLISSFCSFSIMVDWEFRISFIHCWKEMNHVNSSIVPFLEAFAC